MTDQRQKPSIVRGRDIMGHKVVAIDTGSMLDDVDEILYDPEQHVVRALVVDKGGWFSDAKVILFSDIKTIGRDAVIVPSEQVVRKASEVQERIQRIVRGENYLTTNKVMTTDGTELGSVDDILFDTVTGRVTELEISEGFIGAIESGRKRVMVTDVEKIGQDVTIVRKYVEADIEAQAKRQGLRGMVTDVEERIPQIQDRIRSGAADAADQARETASQLTKNTKQTARDLRSDPGVEDTVDDLRHRTEGAVDSAKQSLTDVFQKAREKTSEMMEEYEDRRIAGAIGRYVTVNILSRDDRIVARRGDLITHTLIRDADRSGMLEQVLDNASPEPIDQPGSESVDLDLNVRNVAASAGGTARRKKKP